MDLSCWEIYELSSLKRHSLILRPILCKSNAIFRQQFQKFDSNNFTSVSNVLFLKCVAHKRKSCLLYIFIHFLVRIHWIGLQIVYFLKQRI